MLVLTKQLIEDQNNLIDYIQKGYNIKNKNKERKNKMNTQQQSKLENRLKEIESTYYNVDSDARHDLICERAEIEFQINKSNINFRLSGDNKYYYASHCKQFTDNLLKYGYGRKTPEEIKKTGISFHNHSINFGYSTYCDDLKRFETKTELLGFVIGYNNAISNLKNN